MFTVVVAVPESVLISADIVQTTVLAMALFGLGAAVRLRKLVQTGRRGPGWTG